MIQLKTTNLRLLIVALLVNTNGVAIANTVTHKLETKSELKTQPPQVSAKSKHIPQINPGDFTLLKIKKHQKERPNIYFGRQKVAVLDAGKNWHAYVGVGKKVTAGKYVISTVEQDKSNSTHHFVVKPSIYLSDSLGVKRSSTLIQRITKKTKTPINRFKVPSNLPWSNIEPKLPLIYPARGNWTPYQQTPTTQKTPQTQNQPISHQEYIRLTTTEAQAIVSPSDAICLRVDIQNSSYAVWLDHGMGIYSHISGLNSVTLTEQDRIKRGAAISHITANEAGAANINVTTIDWRLIMNKQLINPHKIISNN